MDILLALGVGMGVLAMILLLGVAHAADRHR
jgi:hypothetical protein